MVLKTHGIHSEVMLLLDLRGGTPYDGGHLQQSQWLP